MRSLPAVRVFIVVATLAPLVSATFFGHKRWPWNEERPRVCIIHLGDCKTRAPVCGRLEGSNLCQKFRNSCYLDVANCNHATPYHAIGMKYCKGLDTLNTRGRCEGLPPSQGDDGDTADLLTGLLRRKKLKDFQL